MDFSGFSGDFQLFQLNFIHHESFDFLHSCHIPHFFFTTKPKWFPTIPVTLRSSCSSSHLLQSLIACLPLSLQLQIFDTIAKLIRRRTAPATQPPSHSDRHATGQLAFGRFLFVFLHFLLCCGGVKYYTHIYLFSQLWEDTNR